MDASDKMERKICKNRNFRKIYTHFAEDGIVSRDS